MSTYRAEPAVVIPSTVRRHVGWLERRHRRRMAEEAAHAFVPIIRCATQQAKQSEADGDTFAAAVHRTHVGLLKAVVTDLEILAVGRPMTYWID